MALEVAFRQERAGIVIVAPTGSIDSDTDTLLEERLDDVLGGEFKQVVLDMEGVDYMSSGGVRVILKTKKQLMKRGRDLMLLNMQPQIIKVFEIIHALPSLQVFSSVSELDAYLDAMQRKVIEDQAK